jgi:hypothetical protein
MSGGFAITPALVDDPPERRKKVRHPLHFIHNDKFAALNIEKRPRIAEQSAVSAIFKIKVKGRCATFFGNAACQCGLANLTRSEQDHAWHMIQAFANKAIKATGNHPGKLDGISKLSSKSKI